MFPGTSCIPRSHGFFFLVFFFFFASFFSPSVFHHEMLSVKKKKCPEVQSLSRLCHVKLLVPGRTMVRRPPIPTFEQLETGPRRDMLVPCASFRTLQFRRLLPNFIFFHQHKQQQQLTTTHLSDLAGTVQSVPSLSYRIGAHLRCLSCVVTVSRIRCQSNKVLLHLFALSEWRLPLVGGAELDR